MAWTKAVQKAVRLVDPTVGNLVACWAVLTADNWADLSAAHWVVQLDECSVERLVSKSVDGMAVHLAECWVDHWVGSWEMLRADC